MLINITPAEDLAVWSTYIHFGPSPKKNMMNSWTWSQQLQYPITRNEHHQQPINHFSCISTFPTHKQSENRNKPSPSWRKNAEPNRLPHFLRKSGQILCNVQGSTLHRSDKPRLLAPRTNFIENCKCHNHPRRNKEDVHIYLILALKAPWSMTLWLWIPESSSAVDRGVARTGHPKLSSPNWNSTVWHSAWVKTCKFAAIWSVPHLEVS